MSDTLEFPEVEDIFENIGTDPMKAREAAREVLIQIGNDPEKLGAGLSTERKQKGRSARAKGHDLANRTIAHYEKQGYLAMRVDFTVGGGYAPIQSVDLMGFADVMAFKYYETGGVRLIFIQVTTDEQRTAHERKLCDTVRRVPRILRTPYELASEALSKGAEIHLVTWRKDGSRWAEPTVFNVTTPWLDERKAKLETRRGKR